MNRNSVIVTALTATAMIAAVVLGVRWLLNQSAPSVASDPIELNESVTPTGPAVSTEKPESGGRLRVELYVLDDSGRDLTPVTQEIPLEPSVQQQAKQVVRLLLRRSGAIPAGVQLRELFISPQGVAYLDLSPELVANHPGGSSAEQLTVYSLSTTLVRNFPSIQRVKLLVDGREIPTLAGHLDLSIPYGPMPTDRNGSPSGGGL